MKKKLYIAYGSNLNHQQMKYRCPTAKLLGTGEIRDYELQFKGAMNNAYATIAPHEGSTVPVAVWELQPEDERSLDRYEGYPSHYFKRDIPVTVNGKEMSAMAYIMNLNMSFGLPSLHYFGVVCEGYSDCGFGIKLLNQALHKSEMMMQYANSTADDEEEDEYEDEDLDDEDEDFDYDDLDESDESETEDLGFQQLSL